MNISQGWHYGNRQRLLECVWRQNHLTFIQTQAIRQHRTIFVEIKYYPFMNSRWEGTAVELMTSFPLTLEDGKEKLGVTCKVCQQ